MITRIEERHEVDAGGRGSRRAARVPVREIRTAHLEIRPPRCASVRAAIVYLAVLVAGVPAAHAQGRWHLDLQAGAFSPISDISFEEDFTEFDIDLDTGGAFAAEGGYALDRWADFTARFQIATHFDAYDESVNIYSFTVGGRFFPLPMVSRVRPWLGGQIGWYGVDARLDDFYYFDHYYDDDDIGDFENSFGINAGGGIDFPINPFVSLGFDVRYHNAFEAFDGFEFVTTMFNVSLWFGYEPGPEPPRSDYPRSDSDTPPVPRTY